MTLIAAPFDRVAADVLVALGRMRALGLKVGVISNGLVEAVDVFRASRLAPLVDDVVFSCLVGCAKPDAAIYRLACARLEAAPNQALFVGDGSSDELAGAAAVGLRPYWATWFLDRWPPGSGPPGRDVAAERARSAAFPRLRSLQAVVRAVEEAVQAHPAPGIGPASGTPGVPAPRPPLA